MIHQKDPNKLTEKFISENFGISSPTYTDFRDCIVSWWNKDKYCKLLDNSLKTWCKQFQLNYRNLEDFQDLFINHSYLLILANLIINSYLKRIKENHSINKGLIEQVSVDFSLDNLERFSFLEYLTFEELKSIKQEVSSNILKKLNTLTDWKLKEDIFQGLYEQLVNKSSRHEKGEYYTPDWLSQLIIQETWDLWIKKKNKIKENPTILDPACGSGTFLFNYQYYYYNSLDSSKENYLEIFGFDINPIAVYVAQINSIFSLPQIILVKAISQKSYFYKKIVQKDALKENSLLDYIEENQNDYKFDILVGNPPWIVLRSINDTDYQKELKKDFIKYNLVSRKDVHLFTQLDLATLFFMKCSKQYLKKGGITAFVMPKSVIVGAIQHEKFREFKYPQLNLLLIFDLQKVSPLFLMPSCVLFTVKGEETHYPVKMKVYEGKLPQIRTNLSTVKELITINEIEYSPPLSKTSKSFYYDKFKVGISIFPRNFYFVKLIEKKDSYYCYETDPEIRKLAKPRWREVYIKGKIEVEFIFTTLLSWEMYPFGYKNLRTVLLPVIATSGEDSSAFYPLNLDSLKTHGKHAFQWFSKAERNWNDLCTEKSKHRFPTLLSRLNYNNLISEQNPDKRYIVSYSGTGTNITACVIDKQAERGNLESFPFLADVKVWFFETNDRSEAHYLCAVLNSNILNQLIKPLQPQGLGGGRAIHRRALSFPIIEYKSELLQKELAHLSEKAHLLLSTHQFLNTSKMRREAKVIINDVLMEIDRKVNQLFKM